MDFNLVWFILIVVLFTGFFILEGFDYGVGMLLIGRSESERTQLIRAIGPIWHGNSVWMITAGGASFAAFPHFYATLFSTAYLALFLMLLALIMRGVAFELRGKFQDKGWKCFWDGAIVFGSIVPAFLWGVTFANLLRGLPIDAQMYYHGGFFDLLTPYTILAGLTFVLLFAVHGLTFLTLKIADKRILLDLRKQSFCLGIVACLVYFIFMFMTMYETDAMTKTSGVMIFAVALGIFSAGCEFAYKGEKLSPFVTTTISVVLTTIAFFVALFPRLMVSSLADEWSVTIYNAASTPDTLLIMTVAAVILVPIVLCYQYWTYKIFKDRVEQIN